MDSRGLVTVCLLLSLLAPIALPGAQAGILFEDAPLLEDPPGDTYIMTPDGTKHSEGGADNTDLLAAWIKEDPFALHFKFQVASLEGDAEADNGGHDLIFTHRDHTYRLSMYRTFDNDEGFFGGMITRTTDGDFVDSIGLRVNGDLDAGTLSTSIPRNAFASGLRAGNELVDIHMESRSIEGDLVVGRIERGDDAPAEGEPRPTYTLQWGTLPQDASLDLTTDEPFWHSNGEATSYRYIVRLANLDTAPADIELSLRDVPDAWNVTLPGDRLTVGAATTVEFPVYLKAPFNHVHGATEAFTLHAMSGDQMVDLRMGIHYLDIPHPAGHHDTMYLHPHLWSKTAEVVNELLGGTNGYLTFNTEPSESAAAINGWGSNVNDDTYYGWNLCLDPALSMGLDFDLDRVGQALIPFEVRRPTQGIEVTAELVLYPGQGLNTYCSSGAAESSEKLVLATFTFAAGDVAPTGSFTLDAPIIPTTESNFLPFEEGMNLGLEIRMRGTTPQTSGLPPLLHAGGSLQLPLVDYHDPAGVPAFQADRPAAQEDLDTSAFQQPEVQESPFGAWLAALAVAIALARRR